MDRKTLARGGGSIKKQRRDWWGVLVGVIVLMFASALLGQSETGKGVGAPPGSAYSTDPDGLSAIYQVLGEKRLAVRSERSFDRLPADVDRLLVWDPASLSLNEWLQLTAWVQEGNTAVVSVPTDQPDVTLPAWLPAHLAATAVDPKASATAVSAAASPVTLGVDSLSIGPGTFLNTDPNVLIELTRPDGQPVLVSWAVGKGRIYWSADDRWLTNARIDQADNLVLAQRLLLPAAGRHVAFDEYHHGYQAADAWWQLLRGPLQLLLLQLAVALLIFFWAYGVRFGAPRPLPEGPPRAAVEYVYSMSQLYRRARARSLAMQALYRNLTRELGRLVGGSQGLTHAQIAERAAGPTGIAAERIEAALNRSAGQAGKELGEAQMIALARDVEAIQRGVRNAGYRDQHETGKGAD